MNGRIVVSAKFKKKKLVICQNFDVCLPNIVNADFVLVEMVNMNRKDECCCCFSNEDLFNMFEPYKFEIYSTMIADCFQIVLSSYIEECDKSLYLICKKCVFRLRDAIALRCQIQTAFGRLQAKSRKKDHPGDISSENSTVAKAKENIPNQRMEKENENTHHNEERPKMCKCKIGSEYIDATQLISIVRGYEELYNINHPHHLDLTRRDNIWEEIGKKMNRNSFSCRDRWAKIRENHRKALKLRKSKSSEVRSSMKPPKHFKELSFMAPYFKSEEDRRTYLMLKYSKATETNENILNCDISDSDDCCEITIDDPGECSDVEANENISNNYILNSDEHREAIIDEHVECLDDVETKEHIPNEDIFNLVEHHCEAKKDDRVPVECSHAETKENIQNYDISNLNEHNYCKIKEDGHDSIECSVIETKENVPDDKISNLDEHDYCQVKRDQRVSIESSDVEIKENVPNEDISNLDKQNCEIIKDEHVPVEYLDVDMAGYIPNLDEQHREVKEEECSDVEMKENVSISDISNENVFNKLKILKVVLEKMDNNQMKNVTVILTGERFKTARDTNGECDSQISNIFLCNICNRIFRNSCSIQRHMKFHQRRLKNDSIILKERTITDKLVCDICERIFKRKDFLRNHMMFHMGMLNKICEICNKRFVCKAALGRHVQSIHAKSVSCHHCGKYFANKSILEQHLKVHTRKCRFTCKICGENFHMKQAYKIHVLEHSVTKKEKCEICNETFATMDVLAIHMRSHFNPNKWTFKLIY